MSCDDYKCSVLSIDVCRVVFVITIEFLLILLRFVIHTVYGDRFLSHYACHLDPLYLYSIKAFYILIIPITSSTLTIFTQSSFSLAVLNLLAIRIRSNINNSPRFKNCFKIAYKCLPRHLTPPTDNYFLLFYLFFFSLSFRDVIPLLNRVM